MVFEPKILFNPKNEVVSFMYDHQSYVLQPGEKRIFEGPVADHALRFASAGLKEYAPGTDDKLVLSSTVAYDKMPWREVVSLASARGLFKPGMGKETILRALVEADNEQGA